MNCNNFRGRLLLIVYIIVRFRNKLLNKNYLIKIEIFTNIEEVLSPEVLSSISTATIVYLKNKCMTSISRTTTVYLNSQHRMFKKPVKCISKAYTFCMKISVVKIAHRLSQQPMNSIFKVSIVHFNSQTPLSQEPLQSISRILSSVSQMPDRLSWEQVKPFSKPVLSISRPSVVYLKNKYRLSQQPV